MAIEEGELEAFPHGRGHVLPSDEKHRIGITCSWTGTGVAGRVDTVLHAVEFEGRARDQSGGAGNPQ